MPNTKTRTVRRSSIPQESVSSTSIAKVFFLATERFAAPLTANDGTIANSGQIIFNEDATINAGADFQMNSVNASVTVGNGVTVTINDANMDFDGFGATTNVITVEAGGFLDMNLDAFERNDRADGYLERSS